MMLICSKYFQSLSKNPEHILGTIWDLVKKARPQSVILQDCRENCCVDSSLMGCM